MNKKFIPVIGFVIMLGAVLFSNNTSALSSEEIFTRILINNVESCYKNAFVGDVEAKSYAGFNTLMNPGYKQSSSTDYPIIIPTIDDNYNKITEKDSNGKRFVSCYAIFNGDKKEWSSFDGQMQGLFQIFKTNVPTNNKNITNLSEFMNGALAYNINTEQASSTEYCYTAYRKPNTAASDPINLGSYCRNEDNYPITYGQSIKFSGADSNHTVTGSVSSYDDGTTDLVITITHNTKTCLDDFGYPGKCSMSVSFPITLPDLGRKNLSVPIEWTDKPIYYIEVTKNEGVQDSSKLVTYNKNNNNWKKAIEGITKGSYTDSVAFTDADKYDFYSQYLRKNFIQNGGAIANASKCVAEKPATLADAGQDIYYVYVKGSGWCLADVDLNKAKNTPTMTVFSKNQRYKLDSSINSLSELINLMGELDLNDDDIIDIETAGTADDPGEVDEVSPTCMNSGAVNSLGWIVCPIIDLLKNTADGVYEKQIKPALQVQPTLFTENGLNGTEGAWRNFRDIANVVFVIMLLAVIFSQLTGYGIDNYGIKKILPKLILAAVLINLSYIICQICVDLSNIIGNGLQSMFDTMSFVNEDIRIDSDGFGAGGSVSVGGGGGTITAISVFVSIAGIAAVFANPALILTLLVSGIGIVISVLFLFVLLAGRQAAVVILTVISPIAIILFMLPNTKKYFDKWLKFFGAMLMLYPIAGLLIGGGNYVSRLLLSINAFNGPAMAFTSVIIGAIPIFLIPSVLKGSFSALGSFGGKLSGFGERLRGGAEKRMRGSELYKGAQELGRMRQTRIRAGVDKDGNAIGGIRGGISRVMAGGKRNQARSRAQFLQDRAATARGEGLMGAGMAAAVLAQDKSADAQEISDWETLIKDQTNDGAEEGKLIELFNKYDREGNYKAARAVARVASRRKDTAKRFIDNTIGNTSMHYDSKTLGGVAKELTEGQNSKAVRAGSPLEFEYLARINDGTIKGTSYSDWLTPDNIHDALEHHVTTSEEFGAIQGKELETIANLMETPGAMAPQDIERMRGLANELIRFNQQNGVQMDSTKIEHINRIAGVAGGTTGATANVSASTSSTPSPEVFTARGADGAEVSITKGNDGSWHDSSGQVIEDADRVMRNIEASRRKQEKYDSMSDYQVADLATRPDVSERIRENAQKQIEKRGGIDNLKI